MSFLTTNSRPGLERLLAHARRLCADAGLFSWYSNEVLKDIRFRCNDGYVPSDHEYERIPAIIGDMRRRQDEDLRWARKFIFEQGRGLAALQRFQILDRLETDIANEGYSDALVQRYQNEIGQCSIVNYNARDFVAIDDVTSNRSNIWSLLRELRVPVIFVLCLPLAYGMLAASGEYRFWTYVIANAVVDYIWMARMIAIIVVPAYVFGYLLEYLKPRLPRFAVWLGICAALACLVGTLEFYSIGLTWVSRHVPGVAHVLATRATSAGADY